MDCSKIKGYLLDSLLGEVLPKEAEEMLKEHLSACPRCRQAAEKFSLAWKSLDGLDEVSFPSDLTDRVLGRVERESGFPAFLARFPAYGWAAGALLIVAGGVALALHFGGEDRLVADRSASTFSREELALPDASAILDSYLEESADLLTGFRRGSYPDWGEALRAILAGDLPGRANYLMEQLPPGSSSYRLVKELHDSFWTVLQAGRGRENERVALPRDVDVDYLLKEIRKFRKKQ